MMFSINILYLREREREGVDFFKDDFTFSMEEIYSNIWNIFDFEEFTTGY